MEKVPVIGGPQEMEHRQIADMVGVVNCPLMLVDGMTAKVAVVVVEGRYLLLEEDLCTLPEGRSLLLVEVPRRLLLVVVQRRLLHLVLSPGTGAVCSPMQTGHDRRSNRGGKRTLCCPKRSWRWGRTAPSEYCR